MSNISNIELTDFVRNKLKPILFERLAEAFPYMDFTLRRGNWYSPKHIDGSLSTTGKKERSLVSQKFPDRIINIDAEYINGNKSIDLIELCQLHENYTEPIDAIKALSYRMGLTLPDLSPEAQERYRKEKTEQDLLEAVALQIKDALFSAEGADVLSYLKRSRAEGGRGYSEDLIKAMSETGTIGCITPSIAEDLRHKLNDGSFGSISYDIGKTHTFAVIRRERGKIVAINVRSLDSRPDKYRLISRNDSRTGTLTGLSLLKLTGDRDRDYDLTIVEGELDALHAQAVGVENIVATGRDISNTKDGLIRARKLNGVKRVTILFDTGEQGTEEMIDHAIETISASGLKAYIAKLPSVSGKMDVDEYLLTHTAEDLKQITTPKDSGGQALSVMQYRLDRIWERHSRSYDPDKLTDELQDLYASPELNAMDRESLIVQAQEMIQYNGDLIYSKEALREVLQGAKEKQDRIRRRADTMEAVKRISTMVQEGKTAEAINQLKVEYKQLRDLTDKNLFADLFTPKEREDALFMLRNIPTGTETEYVFRDPVTKEPQQLTIPDGALTIVGAPTSHGKSTFLRNLALYFAEKTESNEVVLYFTFEEEESAVLTHFINTYTNMDLHTNSVKHPQIKTIRNYYRTGKPDFFRDNMIKPFEEKSLDFLDRYYGKKLRIYNRSYDAETLLYALKACVKTLNVKAVFIDYIQLLKKTNYKSTRSEELKEICIELKDFAIETKLPVILACQVTRTISSPVGLSNQNLAESSDIEKSANTIVCLWNGSSPIGVNATSAEAKETEKIQTRLGLTFGYSRDKIYAKLTKCRDGVKDLDAVFSFKGNTGRITNSELSSRAEASGSPEAKSTRLKSYDQDISEPKLPYKD